MENDILLAKKHIKEVSKKKVTTAKIEQFIKRNKIEKSTEELNRITENLFNNGVMQMQGENENTTYIISKETESIAVVLISHTQEPSLSNSQNQRVNFTQDGDGKFAHGLAVSESNNNIEQDPMDPVQKNITSLKSFWEIVVKKLYELEKTLIISQQPNPCSSIGNVGSGEENCNLMVNQILL